MAKKQNIKQKHYCNSFSKDSKNDPHQKKKKILKKICTEPRYFSSFYSWRNQGKEWESDLTQVQAKG